MERKPPIPPNSNTVDLSGLVVDDGMGATLDRVYDSAADFEMALSALAEQLPQKASLVVKKAVFMLVSELINTTPKDTGRCAVGWQVSVDSESDYAPPPGDYRDAIDTSKFAGLLVATEVYNIENNVEYVLYLENGHSKKAPTGFIANALAKFSDDFVKCAAEMGFEATS